MNTSVIVSPARTFTALSPEDLRRCAPSVFAEHARPGVSSRYTFVSTAQVVALLGAEGWEPVKASEQRVRLEDRVGFQMHEVRFARRVDLDAGAFQVGSTRAEMILQNAHDGSRAYRIDAGLYRLVCRNGLTVADADFAHVSIRHVDVPRRRSPKRHSLWRRTPLARWRRLRNRRPFSFLIPREWSLHGARRACVGMQTSRS